MVQGGKEGLAGSIHFQSRRKTQSSQGGHRLGMSGRVADLPLGESMKNQQGERVGFRDNRINRVLDKKLGEKKAY